MWLRDIQLYVFCQEYRQHKQRKGREGAFEIEFVTDQGEPADGNCEIRWPAC